MLDPLSEYKQRLAARQKWMNECRWKIRILGYVRLAVGGVIAVTVWLSVVLKLFSAWFIVIPVVVFLSLLNYHERLYAEGRRATRSVAFYERGLARIEDRWAGTGNTETSFADETHLYAADLDLFGKGSLFELLCTARTRSGEETLARWLLGPASREEILNRQDAVRELRDNVDLREDLSVLADNVRNAVNPEFLRQWAHDPSELQNRAARVAIPILVALTFGSLIYWWFTDVGSYLVALLITEAVVGVSYRKSVREVLSAIDEPANELRVLHSALARLKRESFKAEKLQELRTRIETTGSHASEQIASFLKVVEWLEFRRNEYLALLAPLFLGVQLSYATEAWRRRNGPHLEQWLYAVGEVEALCALAGYSYEHPNDPFPEVVAGQTLLEASDVRHPLLPHSQCVPNSLKLGGELQLLIVSGSNMSGKSTLLRTVGINTVLAQAGAPVRAKRLRLSLVEIGATLRVQDSLQGGTSRFYAEIRRLHDVMELTKGPRPVLFLFDEILHGTNSHDRAIGAEAVVRGLVERGAIGLVTTHDLALARVAEALSPRAANVHFEDHLESGKMIFDYRLRSGVVQKSNALELMRAVGLQV